MKKLILLTMVAFLSGCVTTSEEYNRMEAEAYGYEVIKTYDYEYTLVKDTSGQFWILTHAWGSKGLIVDKTRPVGGGY